MASSGADPELLTTDPALLEAWQRAIHKELMSPSPIFQAHPCVPVTAPRLTLRERLRETTTRSILRLRWRLYDAAMWIAGKLDPF